MKTKDRRIDLPSVNEVLEKVAFPDLDPHILTRIVREVLAGIRSAAIVKNRADYLTAILETVHREVNSLVHGGLRNVINGSGIILHTGLGRALLPEGASEALKSIADGFCDLEINRETGARGNRIDRIERLVTLLTGAESCTVVNNNAAAVFLVLNTLASGREVIVSRGELVEIGGSFRLPEIMQQAGAILREIGTTNKTRRSDYERAINKKTAMILKVHTSNYRIEGFTSAVGLPDLAPLCRKKRIPLVHDLGGGALMDLRKWNLPNEPVVGDSLREGADLVTFSGDKTLGGPQSGIVAGRGSLITKLRRNPLQRVLRCDKLTIAALESTLRLYLNPQELANRHTTLKFMTKSVEDCRRQAETLAKTLRDVDHLKIRVVETQSEAGSGTLPGEKLESVAVEITMDGVDPATLARRMRLSEPAIVGYTRRGHYRIDLRTVLDGQERLITDAVMKIVAER